MERLSFVLPEWTRIGWASSRARQVWEPRLRRVLEAWSLVERLSVREGLRQAALQHVRPEALPELSAWAARNGLVAVPVGTAGASSTYQAAARPPGPGEPFEYRVAIVRPGAAAEFVDAFQAGDDETTGQLLGYPACCRAFFREVWVEQKFVDTTWPMAERTPEAEGGERTIDIKGTPPEANILLRWLGVRAVPHLPHSFSCPKTVEFGRQLLALGEASGFAEEVAWIREMLRWPVEWSALHGIAIIVTPVVKISTRTDATAEKYVVRYHGDLYPEEGARGLVFPFRPPQRRLTETQAYRRAFEAAGSRADGERSA